MFTAVVYVLTSGCAWRYLPGSFGVSPATAHRWFSVWTEAGLWRRSHRAVLDELGAGARWTGRPRPSMPRRCGRKGGLADRSQSGRSRKAGQQTARAVRGPRAAAVIWDLTFGDLPGKRLAIRLLRPPENIPTRTSPSSAPGADGHPAPYR
ncbi:MULTISPECIES: transposase [Streptomyces]|uniref:transposase n=1 Tax=Streptomyces TaxID=1883 RepID=UPI001C46F0CD|nr:transposase [Streptomyces sp. S-2]